MALFEQLASKMVADLVRDYKLQAFQAAAFPGNAGVESGGFTQLQEISPTSGRGGLGFFQDTGPRRVAFEAWLARNADKNWSAGDYAANYSFLVRELDGEERRVLAPLRASTTIEEATEIVMRVFERPALATAHLERRIDYARKALAAFQATGADEAALRAQGRPGAAAMDGEVLPPLHTLPATVSPDMSRAFAVLADLQQVLASPQVRAAVLPLLAQLLGISPTTAPTPSPKPAPANTMPSVKLSVAALFSSFIGMAAGQVGTPFGLGADPTMAGTLSTLIPIATGIVGLLPGGWGALATGGLRLLGGLAQKLPQAPQ